MQKETEDKIKQGTLKVDHGSDAMTVVLGKEKRGYAKGVGGGVTYRRFLICLKTNKHLMKEWCYFKLNLRMRDARVKKKNRSSRI